MSGMHANTGKALADLDHIAQSVRDIITTPIGSRIMRRNYGSLFPFLVDQPLNGATLLRAYAAVADSIRLWEKRITVTGVTFQVDDVGQLTVELAYTQSGNTTNTLQVPLGIKGAIQ